MKKGALVGLLGIIVSISGLTYAANLNVGELDVDFCNGSNKLHIDMDAETSTGICMNLKNIGGNAGLVSFGFVDGEMSQGEEPVQACKTSADGVFGKSITMTGAGIFPIKGYEVIQRTGTISIPKGIAGSLYGCITYSVLADEGTTGDGKQMFTIISRKANTISISVSGAVISNIEFIDGLQLVRNGDGVYTISMKIKNNGTTNERLMGRLYIDDGLIFSKEIQIGNNIELYPDEEKEFKIEIGELPWYGGVYSIKSIITHTPVDIAGNIQGDSGKVELSINHEFGILKYGLLPLLGGAFIVLLILFFIERPFVLRRKARRHSKKLLKKELKKQEKEVKIASKKKE